MGEKTLSSWAGAWGKLTPSLKVMLEIALKKKTGSQHIAQASLELGIVSAPYPLNTAD